MEYLDDEWWKTVESERVKGLIVGIIVGILLALAFV